VPEEPAEFTAVQESQQAVLRWVWPQRTTSGELLRREIDLFEVFALDIARDSQPTPEMMDRLGAAITRVRTEDLEVEPGDTVGASAPLTERYGKRTAVAVRARTAKGRNSPWSQIVVLDVVRPPEPPQGLRAETATDGVRLQWSPTDRASSYVVEKRVKGSEDFQTVGRTDSPDFLDRAILWGAEHEYRVRAEAPAASGNVAGARSQVAAVLALDTFAPPRPDQLRAVVAGDSVELTWRASETYDLAGYRLLRDGEPVHPGLLESPSFSDTDTSRPGTRAYSVVAVDQSGNESEASQVVEVQVR